MKKNHSPVELKSCIIKTRIAERSTGLLSTKTHIADRSTDMLSTKTHSRQVYRNAVCQNRLVGSIVLYFMKCIKLTHIDEVRRLLSIPGLQRRLFASDVDTGMLAVLLSVAGGYFDFKTK